MTESQPSVLIVGGDGFIGRSLTRKLQTTGWSVLSTTRRPGLVSPTRPYLDLLRPELDLGAKMFRKVHHAIICSGVTSIVTCEQNPISTRFINVEGVTHLARLIMESGINLTFLSSSAVFGESSESPLPLDRPAPNCEYGLQKFATEQNLTALGKPLKVIRLTKIVNPNNSIFSKWIIDLKSGSKIFAFDNVLVAPISIDYCNSFIEGLLLSNQTGIFHAAPTRALTYYDIANYITLKLGLDTNMVRPIKNGQNGAYATNGGHLGGVQNDAVMPPQPCPKEAIDNLLYDYDESHL